MERTNTIKGKEVIAYKYMDKNMCCKGFQYEIGKTYKANQVKLNEFGFHACLNPTTVLEYQPMQFARYFKVKLSGEITKCGMWDTNVAATEITILEEITDLYKVINNTEWWKNDNVIDLLYYSEGFARIRTCERQYNFITKDGKILSEQWYKFADIYRDGFALVEREDGLQNYIDKQGKLLSNDWLDWLDNFKDGLAVVKRANGKYNFIDTKGKILSNEWFRWVDYFKDGLAVVGRINGEWAKIDKQGKIVICK